MHNFGTNFESDRLFGVVSLSNLNESNTKPLIFADIVSKNQWLYSVRTRDMIFSHFYKFSVIKINLFSIRKVCVTTGNKPEG